MKKKVMCGNVAIGGGAPLSIQSMTNTDTRDVKSSLEQIRRLAEAGCQIVRLAVPDMEAAQAFGRIKKESPLPMVADIHFDYRLAIESLKQGADKIRINPGNIGDVQRVAQVVAEAKTRQVPIRVGVNSGSLEKDILEKYGHVTAEGLAESALRSVKLVEDLGYDNLVISLKSSDVKLNYDAYRIVWEKSPYPLHIGITESGTAESGRLKSAVGIGSLLLAGIGDTMRVSLTADPVKEIYLAREILKACGLRKAGINLISCPTCGRTRLNLEAIAGEFSDRLAELEEKREKKGLPPITVAIMGCAVNGPGEAREADYGLAGGEGKAVIFAKGQILMTVGEDEALSQLIKLIEEN